METRVARACLACGHEADAQPAVGSPPGIARVDCATCGTTSFHLPDEHAVDRYAELYDSAGDDDAFSGSLARKRLELLGAVPGGLVPPPRLTTADRVVLAEVAAAVAAGSRVLDWGCGSGRLVQALRARGFDALGAEVSDGLVEAMVEAGIPAVTCDVALERWEGEQPAAIVLAEVLEHLPEPADALTSLRERFPAAVVLATVPSPTRLAALRGELEAWDHPPNHLSRFSEAGLRQLFERSGFDAEVRVPPAGPADATPAWYGRALRSAARLGPSLDGGDPVDGGSEPAAGTGRRASALALLWAHAAYLRAGDLLGRAATAPLRRAGASAGSMVAVGRPRPVSA